MLRGNKVVLRTLLDSDLPVLHSLLSDIACRGPFYPVDMTSMRTLRKQYDEDGLWGNRMGMMLIETASDRRVVGNISCFKTVNYIDGVELGFTIFRPEDRGQGYMTEAVRLFTSYLFESRKIARVQLATLPDNEASRRVALRCGYQLEGVLRRALFIRGRSSDVELYSILAGECPPLSELLVEGAEAVAAEESRRL